MRHVGIHLGLLALSALLFALAFPSFLSDWGWFPLAYVSIAPAVYVVNRCSWRAAPLYGLFYGFAAYALHNYWLINFHALTIFVVPVIYAFYFLILFPVLKAAYEWVPKYGFVVQAVLWIGYEILRIQGFLGYAYGILGYSQYQLPVLVRVASVTGVWGVSLLVVFPSFLIADAAARGSLRSWAVVGRYLRRHVVPVGAYGVLLAAALVVGTVSWVDYSDAEMWRAGLVQQDIDPHRGGTAAYEESLRRSIRQSEQALADDPDLDVVIWSETSFVPPIRYHLQYRESPERYQLVRELQAFMEEQPVPYIIGNSDARRERQEDGSVERVDYNAAVLFDDGQIQETYRKVHLVPFTEHFPYRDTLPWMYNLLQDFDTHFWGEGTDYTVFESDGVRFSTPICFEDTFGYLSRRFVNEGADMIVNLTNDSWAKSVPAAMQHLAMAVFRTTETRRSMLRGTVGGMTAAIDPNGHITHLYEPFSEGYMIAEAPIIRGERTLYLEYGDWFGWAALVVGLVFLGLGGVRKLRGAAS